MFNSAIYGCARSAHWQPALALLRQMAAEETRVITEPRCLVALLDPRSRFLVQLMSWPRRGGRPPQSPDKAGETRPIWGSIRLWYPIFLPFRPVIVPARTTLVKTGNGVGYGIFARSQCQQIPVWSFRMTVEAGVANNDPPRSQSRPGRCVKVSPSAIPSPQ